MASASVAVLALWFLTNQRSVGTAQYDEQRVLRFNYEVSNTTNRVLNDTWLKTHLPLDLTSHQRLTKLTVSKPHSVISEQSGNHVLQLDLGDIAPFGTRTLNITVTLNMAKQANKVKEIPPPRFLSLQGLVGEGDNTVSELAVTLKGNTDAESVANIANWVNKNIEFSGFSKHDINATQALEKRRGDSTDYMVLVAALVRTLGIPARPVGGFVYANNSIVKHADYHNWVEVYIDRAWRTIDAQNSPVVESPQHYIVVRIIEDESVLDLPNGHQFATVSEGLSF